MNRWRLLHSVCIAVLLPSAFAGMLLSMVVLTNKQEEVFPAQIENIEKALELASPSQVKSLFRKNLSTQMSMANALVSVWRALLFFSIVNFIIGLTLLLIHRKSSLKSRCD